VEYITVQTLEEAVSLISEKPAGKIIAGGTDLIVQMRDLCAEPPLLIDIAGIKELKRIEKNGGLLFIGACTPIADIADSKILPRALVLGARSIGSPQIRNLGTIGGNICNASPCGDTLPGLLTLSAEFHIASSRGTRKVSAEDFFTGPKKTVMEKDEILTIIEIPEKYTSGASAFGMIGKRNGQVISQVNSAAWADTGEGKGGLIREIRIAFGSVAPVPVRTKKIENFITGKKLTPEIIEKGMKLMHEEILPITDVRSSEEYRFSVAEGLLLDILTEISKALEEAA